MSLNECSKILNNIFTEYNTASHNIIIAHVRPILWRPHWSGAVSTRAHGRVEPSHERTQHSVSPPATAAGRATRVDQICHHAYSGPARPSNRAHYELSDLQPGTGVQSGQRGCAVVGLRDGSQRGIHTAQPVFWAATVRTGRVCSIIQERPVQRAHRLAPNPSNPSSLISNGAIRPHEPGLLQPGKPHVQQFHAHGT